MRGIFRKKVQKEQNFGAGAPVLCEREVPHEIEVDGVLTKVIDIEVSDMKDIPMPTREEYDLETMLKAGVMPQAINVRGILPNEKGQYDAIAAFNSLQDQIDALNENVQSNDGKE